MTQEEILNTSLDALDLSKASFQNKVNVVSIAVTDLLATQASLAQQLLDLSQSGTIDLTDEILRVNQSITQVSGFRDTLAGLPTF